MIAWIILIYLRLIGIEAVHIQSIEVPEEVEAGDDFRLKCWVDPWPGPLYSLAWWKDDLQFYRAALVASPEGVAGTSYRRKSEAVFDLEGLIVESGVLGEVWVRRVGVRASGTYTCEAVADFPSFSQHTRSAKLTVLDPPDTRPVVWGYRSRYRIGEVLSLNCTVIRCHPQPTITFSINGNKTVGGVVEVVETVLETDHTTTLTSHLSITLTPQHFINKAFNITCLAHVGKKYFTNTTITANLAQPPQKYARTRQKLTQSRPKGPDLAQA